MAAENISMYDRYTLHIPRMGIAIVPIGRKYNYIEANMLHLIAFRHEITPTGKGIMAHAYECAKYSINTQLNIYYYINEIRKILPPRSLRLYPYYKDDLIYCDITLRPLEGYVFYKEGDTDNSFEKITLRIYRKEKMGHVLINNYNIASTANELEVFVNNRNNSNIFVGNEEQKDRILARHSDNPYEPTVLANVHNQIFASLDRSRINFRIQNITLVNYVADGFKTLWKDRNKNIISEDTNDFIKLIKTRVEYIIITVNHIDNHINAVLKRMITLYIRDQDTLINYSNLKMKYPINEQNIFKIGTKEMQDLYAKSAEYIDNIHPMVCADAVYSINHFARYFNAIERIVRFIGVPEEQRRYSLYRLYRLYVLTNLYAHPLKCYMLTYYLIYIIEKASYTYANDKETYKKRKREKDE
jgi:hypothetical protein